MSDTSRMKIKFILPLCVTKKDLLVSDYNCA